MLYSIVTDMYIYVYVINMYIYIYIYIHIYTYIYTYIYIHIYIHICDHMCICGPAFCGPPSPPRWWWSLCKVYNYNIYIFIYLYLYACVYVCSMYMCKSIQYVYVRVYAFVYVSLLPPVVWWAGGGRVGEVTPYDGQFEAIWQLAATSKCLHKSRW